MFLFWLAVVAVVSAVVPKETCVQRRGDQQCSDDRTGYIVWNDDGDSSNVKCPTGYQCVFIQGDECDEICRKIVEPMDFVNTGMLTWSGKQYYEYSGGGGDSYRSGVIRGFSYKLPNGRIYREVYNTYSYRGKWTYDLHIPSEDGNTFKQIHKTVSGCTINEGDSSMGLVPLTLANGHMLPTKGQKQHWIWRYYDEGAASEARWDFYVKYYKGGLVPLSFKESQSQDGMGDGSSGGKELSFKYYPEMVQSMMPSVFAKERELMKSCGIQS